ncbi:hypothetical protein GCM10007981_08410 [Thermocladium modestius]|uniref:Inositol monophosphatase n=1 Tax=Thermocladium modestius TaxID=62609 RepID=A0A830GTF7_9CREN|nr:inositol monophosphatase family protein [Thermocladium modestius]GGP20418.1 hypothetical protein GCM10007981_08410 [Thermocladium modestius]
MSINIKSILEDVGKGAASLIMSKSTDPSYKTIIKEKKNDVTRRIDWEVEDYLIDSLRKHDVPAVILTEERDLVKISSDPSYLFVVDPLDGSLNFVMDIPFYSVSIGVAKYSGDPRMSDLIAGIIIDVQRDAYYYAEKGKGIFVKGNTVKPLGEALDKPIASIYMEPSISMDMFSKIKKIYELLGTFKVRTLGSSSLEATLASFGRFLLFMDIRNKLRIFDIAAAYVIAKELGAYIINPLNGSLDDLGILKQPHINILVTQSKKVMDTVIAAFKE